MTPMTSSSELDQLRGSWGWFMLLGLVLILGGIFMISLPIIGTVFAITFYGWVLLISSVLHLFSAFFVRQWGGLLMMLLAAVLEAVLGLFIVNQPVEAILLITLLLAVWFMVGGAFRLLAAIMQQFPNWGWVFLDGIVTLALGIMVWRNFPRDAPWFIGLAVGINMLFRGWSWIALSIAVRQPPRPAVA